MFNEKFDNNITDLDGMQVKTAPAKEKYDLERHWQVIDTITHPDGKVEKREYFNTVVNDCSKLLACLMKGHGGYSGIKYWAVGSGSSSWNNNSLPNPNVADTKLLAETYRKAISPSDITFLDSSDRPTSDITNKLQVSITFRENEANGELREFGLYGGNATTNKDSGLMINRKIHPIIFKTSGMIVERVIRIVF